MNVEPMRDEEGLRAAALEQMEFDLLAQYETARGRNGERPAGQFADGYYAWLGHLLHIERERALEVTRGMAPLQAVELRGLAALAEARDEFEKRHPSCAHCNAHLIKPGVDICWQCGKKVKEKS